MALLRLECFDNYTGIADGWYSRDISWSSSSSSRCNIGTTTGYGMESVRAATTAYNAYHWVQINLPQMVNGNTCFMGFALANRGYHTYGLKIRDNDADESQLTIHFYSLNDNPPTSNLIAVRRGEHTDAIIAQVTKLIPCNKYMYVEMEFKIHSSDGYLKIWVDGELLLDISGENTQGGTGDGVNAIRNHSSCHWDAFWFCDDTGTKNNTRLVQPNIKYCFAEDDGNYTDWTPNTGANYQCIDDPNDIDHDTTYVSTSTLNDVDTYDMEDISVKGADILAVQYGIAVKMESGSGSIKPIVRYSATDYEISGELAFDTTVYAVDSQMIGEEHPAGGDWTEANFDACEFGIKRMS